MAKRASGALLHTASLPSKYGIGDFGPEAYRFADFLAQANQTYWQVLPLTPPAPGAACSPYDPSSAFAGNTLLISPELLYQAGLLSRRDIRPKPDFPAERIAYRSVIPYKTRLLNIAFERFNSKLKDHDYQAFCYNNRGWLEDFAIFTALRQHLHRPTWRHWPAQLRDRQEKALESAGIQLKNTIERQKLLQYLFFKQWSSLKAYCNRQSISVIGDIPFYVAYDSADVWAHPEFFKLTRTRKPRFVAGVPPDLFSKNGQLWGNPVYNWSALRAAGYSWWIERIKHNLRLFDIVRLDHFRGFVAYWQVPAAHKTAKHGRWIKGPGEDLLGKVFKKSASKSVIVEDLGYITNNVRAVINRLRLRSMRVLQFGFDGDARKNLYWPENYKPNCVVYVGTHDTNTVRGWFENEATPAQKKRLFDYLECKVPPNQVHWALIRVAMSSVAHLIIIPIQDVLGLGEQARMNRPATTESNWTWRLKPGQIRGPVTKKLRRLTQAYGRS